MKNKIFQDGIPAGNWEDKYHSKNPFINRIMQGFKTSIFDLLAPIKSEINSFSECGCGEGEVASYIYDCFKIYNVRAFDFSSEVIKIAKEQNKNREIIFEQQSIYKIPDYYSADLIICCEVLEHLDAPDLALLQMKNLHSKYYLFSVPNEPLWRVLNFLRGKYITNLGNTPGHINHWSPNAFRRFIENNGFEIVQVNNPFPWTMLLAKCKY